jgi:hypothetical protein
MDGQAGNSGIHRTVYALPGPVDLISINSAKSGQAGLDASSRAIPGHLRNMPSPDWNPPDRYGRTDECNGATGLLTHVNKHGHAGQ